MDSDIITPASCATRSCCTCASCQRTTAYLVLPFWWHQRVHSEGGCCDHGVADHKPQSTYYGATLPQVLTTEDDDDATAPGPAGDSPHLISLIRCSRPSSIIASDSYAIHGTPRQYLTFHSPAIDRISIQVTDLKRLPPVSNVRCALRNEFRVPCVMLHGNVPLGPRDTSVSGGGTLSPLAGSTSSSPLLPCCNRRMSRYLQTRQLGSRRRNDAAGSPLPFSPAQRELNSRMRTF